MFSSFVVSILCNPVDNSLPGSSIHRTFPARILEWVAITSSRMKYYLTIKSNEVLIDAIIWMNLKNMPSERRQLQRATYLLIPRQIQSQKIDPTPTMSLVTSREHPCPTQPGCVSRGNSALPGVSTGALTPNNMVIVCNYNQYQVQLTNTGF